MHTETSHNEKGFKLHFLLNLADVAQVICWYLFKLVSTMTGISLQNASLFAQQPYNIFFQLFFRFFYLFICLFYYILYLPILRLTALKDYINIQPSLAVEISLNILADEKKASEFVQDSFSFVKKSNTTIQNNCNHLFRAC